ncbi:MAG: AraC family transcriptional regulator, partial [Cyanobacteria bacterium P01_H01_bin.58]
MMALVSPTKTGQGWHLPGSPDDPRLMNSDPSDQIYVYPSHFCQGYRQQIFLEDDISLVFIDQTLTQAVMTDAPRYGSSLEFEFNLAGPAAGYVHLFPHLCYRDLSYHRPSERTLKVEVLFKLPALRTQIQTLMSYLPHRHKVVAGRFLQAMYRYYNGGGWDLDSNRMINRLFARDANPLTHLTVEQTVSETLYLDMWAIALKRSRITPAMEVLLGQILSCPYSGSTRRIYLKRKALRLVALYLEALLQPLLSPPELDCIDQAEAILRANTASPPSLETLARQVGTNRRKLNEGFHQV